MPPPCGRNCLVVNEVSWNPSFAGIYMGRTITDTADIILQANDEPDSKLSLWAVVPVKVLDESKRRLNATLGSDRRGITLAMLKDVLSALADSRRDIVGRARSGQASLADLQGGTFTISNLGMFGIDAFSAIVNPPQAAILAVGRIADRVVPVEGQPSVQPMMTLTLSCDHRVVDGARGAQFLQTLVSFIEDPLAVLD